MKENKSSNLKIDYLLEIVISEKFLNLWFTLKQSRIYKIYENVIGNVKNFKIYCMREIIKCKRTKNTTFCKRKLVKNRKYK